MTDPSSSYANPLEEDKKTVSVPVLESWKYEEWRKEMKDILTSQKLWEVVTSEYERPKHATELSSWNDDRIRKYRTDQNENEKALMLIQRAVGEQIMKEVHVKLQEKISAKLQEKISANKPKASDQERQSAEWFEKEKFKEPQMVELVATSKDVWMTIEENQKTTAEESKTLTMNCIHVVTSHNDLEEATKSSLFEYAMRGEWDKVKEIYTRKPAAHCAKITNSSDTALHIAVIDGEYDIAEQLVNLMSFEEARSALVVKNELGNTPLHLAAFVGNAKLCGCIASKVYERISTAKKNQNSENEEVKSDQKTSNEIENSSENKEEKEYILLVECNKENEAPLFVAVAQGKTDAFLRLHSYALPKQLISYYRGNKGDTILHVAVSGEYFDLAFQIIHLYPTLVNMVNERGMSPLHCLARRSTAFRSGYRLRPHYSIIYHCKCIFNIRISYEKAPTMQPDSTNRPSQNRNNHRCPDNYETCFHFFTLARAFFSITGQEKLPTTSHDTNNCGHPIQSMISWLKKAFGGGNEADSESAGESRLVPPNYGTIFELLKLGSKTMLVILGLGSSEIRKIRVKKEKHIWSIQVLDKLLEKNELYMYERSGSGGGRPIDLTNSSILDASKQDERSGSGGGRPNDLTNSSILDASKQDEGKLEITYKMEKTDTPLLMAAKNGITEIMEKILDKYSFAIHDLNSQKKNVVLLAVQYRQTHVYQFLIKRWKKNKVPDRVFRQVDDQGNSAMHHAATMIKDYKPWRIPGAALQMQWEIKWYKVYMTQACMCKHKQTHGVTQLSFFSFLFGKIDLIFLIYANFTQLYYDPSMHQPIKLLLFS
ncbi:REPEAT PROTEIN putative-RELATED [Salix purpurea]|uniref:REPEAT PROTEIN putative-RELATED n=1 Tax=Salix purpurea TaxID=77065 RepID=A0A9Q0PB30_SALPP|nr:REPEAT PROTEIN putative-RELATED [Salix purpurea]